LQSSVNSTIEGVGRVGIGSHTARPPNLSDMKRSATNLFRDRNKKQKKPATQESATPRGKAKVPPKPRTPSDRKFAMFEEATKNADTDPDMQTAMQWGKKMVECFWTHFATFDPLDNIANILQREEPSFSEGATKFLKKSKKSYGAALAKAVEKEVLAYRTKRREELDQQQRQALRSKPAVQLLQKPIQRSISAPVLPLDSDLDTIPAVMPAERSIMAAQRNSFYSSGALQVGREASEAYVAVQGVVNKLTCGEVVFATTSTAKETGSIGSYSHRRFGSWSHAGPGSAWAEMFVPSLDRIAQRNIAVGARTPLFFPAQAVDQGVEHMSVIKIGEGKYSQIFAPCNMLASDKPVDLTDWPPMLVRVDNNGGRRSKNVVIRVPRLNGDDRATNDGTMAHAHEEAFNVCEAAYGGFGPSLFAAFFLSDPDPPSLDESPRHAFRFFTIMKRQSVSLDQRSRTSALSALGSPVPRSPGTGRPAGLPAVTCRYLTMLFDTIFEYSARRIVFMDATRGNFMDEEAAFRTVLKFGEVQAVERVNVIDLDPRFYRRLDGAAPEGIWLINTALVLAHMRRIDVKRNFTHKLMNMQLRGGLSVAELLSKVYEEQRHNPRSDWLFSIEWNEIPSQWKPDLESQWKTSIGPQMQQIVGYYFFYAERDSNGRASLETYDRVRCGRNQSAIDSARSRFTTGYITGGGMYAARHFLFAAKDSTVTSLISALLLYVDAAALFKRPELLSNEPYAKPTPLPRMSDPLGPIDGHLGLHLRSSRKIR
jgi:hypothetical protein